MKKETRAHQTKGEETDPNLSKLGKRLTKTSHLERPVHKLVMLR